MSQMPEIKPVVNKEPEGEKKRGGLFARLFGAGAESTAGFGGAGGGLASGGLMATKAGLLTLILAGTTVAGGIGMLGYRLFGPGAGDQAAGGDNLQLFAPKPKEAQSPDGQAASKDGSSESLSAFAKANAVGKAGDASSSDGLKDGTAASAAGSADAGAAAAAGAAGAINKTDGSSGNGVSKNMLKNAAKFGTLSGPNGAGGGGSGAVANAAAGVKPEAAAKSGTLSGFKSGPGVAAGGAARAVASARRFGTMGAAQQGFAVLSNNRGAIGNSGVGSGSTYDGSNPGAGNNIGGPGSAINAPGVTPGAAPAQPTSLAAPANDTNNSTSVPTPTATPEAPWQSAINSAQMMLGLALVLMLVAKLLGHTGIGLTATHVIGGIVIAMGVAVIALGATIANGQYGQKLQGGILAAAGAGLVLAGIRMMSAQSTDAAKAAPAGSAGAPPAPTSTTDAMGTPSTPAAGSSPGMMAGMDPFIMLGGGAALVGVVATMMVPPTKYPASTFNGNPPPDLHLWGYQELPSEKALKTMVA